jgi:hypothetical protein
MKIVIISRKRPALLMGCSMKLFPHATVSIGEDEVDAYARAGVPRKQMLIHPADIVGLSKKRNWVMKNVPDETVVQVDDDGRCVKAMVGQFARPITDETTITMFLKNLEQGAKEIGTVYFGFNNYLGDIRKYKKDAPFSFVNYSNGIVGTIGRSVWYDENIPSHTDVDLVLQCLQKFRVVWIDMRLSFVPAARTSYMYGGKQDFLNAQREKECQRYLKKKWGKFYSPGTFKASGFVRSGINVSRRMSELWTPEKGI